MPKQEPNLWIIILLTTVILGFGLLTTLYRQDATAPDKTPATKNQAGENWQKVPQPNAIINTPITFQPRNKTFMLIPIKFSGTPEFSQLVFESSSSAVPNVFVMHHPTLASLNWPTTELDGITLYQKKKTFNNLTAFLASPPAGKILIDSNLKTLAAFAHLDADPLPSDFDPSQVDYVLTTYKPLKQTGDGFVFERVIDASRAELNPNNALTWLVSVPSATMENPFYIGYVHVDYRY